MIISLKMSNNNNFCVFTGEWDFRTFVRISCYLKNLSKNLNCPTLTCSLFNPNFFIVQPKIVHCSTQTSSLFNLNLFIVQPKIVHCSTQDCSLFNPMKEIIHINKPQSNGGLKISPSRPQEKYII